jgi:hypothetical protein
MIENEHQYIITQKKLKEFQDSLIKTKESACFDCTHEEHSKRKIVIDSLELFIIRFKEDIDSYEHRNFR